MEKECECYEPYRTKDNDLLLNTDKTTCTLLIPDPAEYKAQLGLQIDNTTLPITRTHTPNSSATDT